MSLRAERRIPAESNVINAVFREAVLLVPLRGVMDSGAEKARLQKEVEKLEKDLEGYGRKLGNAGFVGRAPAEVVEEEKRRQTEAEDKRAKLLAALEKMK